MSSNAIKPFLFAGILSILLGPSILSAADKISPYFRGEGSQNAHEHPDDIAQRCRILMQNINGPHRTLKGDEFRPLYTKLRDESAAKAGKNVELHIKELEYYTRNESWFGFEAVGFEKIDFRYHTFNHEVRTQTETVIIFDRADFTDIERLHAFAVKNKMTGAADTLLKELVRRALVPVGDDYLLLRAMWIAYHDQPGLEIPNLLSIIDAREITDFTHKINEGARAMYKNPLTNPRVQELLRRIVKYGYLNVREGIVEPLPLPEVAP